MRYLSCLILLCSSCMLNQPESVRNVVEDFNLGWRGDPKHQSLYVNVDHTEYGGLKIVEETVFALAWNQDFIIALQQQSSDASDTLFHIIDIREYHPRFWGPKDHVSIFDNSRDYQQKIKELGLRDLEIKSVLLEGDLDR